MIYDLIIIGGGPAAMSAGIYAARKKINTLIITKNIGGQAIEAYEVENYLGVSGLMGTDLVKKFSEHLKKFVTDIKEGEIVETIEKAEQNFTVKTNKNAYQSKSIIIASGKSPRELDVPGAKEFAGKGIVYCATCDAPLFKNKTVAIVGAGDAGVDTAWQLTQYADKIYLINKYADLRGDDLTLQEKVKNHSLIEIINQAEIKIIKGTRFVESLIYKQNSTEKEINVDGIFIEIGSMPNSQFAKGTLDLSEKEEIIVNPKNNSTSIPGIFAAGDVTDIKEKQIIIAAGEGAKAALNVYNYLKQQ